MTLKTDNYQIGLDSVTDSKNYLLDTDITGALRIRRNSDGSGATVFNISPDGETVARIKQIPAKALSGTAVDWQPSSSDGPPSWAKKATLVFDRLSTNGTAQILVQLGSTTIQTAGYDSYSVSITNATAIAGNAATSGFHLLDQNAASVRSGRMTLQLASTAQWISDHTLASSTAAVAVLSGAGSVTLTGLLDRLRLTTVGGTNTFDGGSVSVIYEG